MYRLAESVLHQPAMTQILHPNTLASLGVSSITVGAKDRTGVDDAKEVLGVLRTSLNYMRSLKKIDLTFLPCSVYTGGPCPDTITYEQAFPPACQWPNLTELHISKLAVGGLRLVSWLVSDMPRLQRPRLDSLILLDG